MPKMPFVFFPLLLAGCATTPPATGACDGSGLDRFKGGLVNADNARLIQLASGARVVRWLGPKDIVTMEFRSDRVNLVLDDTLHNIVAIRCG